MIKVNITDKLSNDSLEGILQVKDTDLRVFRDAETILELTELIGSGEKFEITLLPKIRDILFDKESIEKIKSLHLSFDDYMLVLQSAIELTMKREDKSKN